MLSNELEAKTKLGGRKIRYILPILRWTIRGEIRQYWKGRSARKLKLQILHSAAAWYCQIRAAWTGNAANYIYFGNANKRKTLLKTFVFHFESKVGKKLVKVTIKNSPQENLKNFVKTLKSQANPALSFYVLTIFFKLNVNFGTLLMD